ncbi:hypothetical protein AB0E09_53600, partial [Streptomyces mirabilis]
LAELRIVEALLGCHDPNYPSGHGLHSRRGTSPGHDGGGARADAEVLLNAAGRQLLTSLCGVEEDVLARALASWGQEDAKLSAAKNGVPAAAWRTGGAVAGPSPDCYWLQPPHTGRARCWRT